MASLDDDDETPLLSAVQIRRVKRAVATLDEVRKELARQHPGANWYLEDANNLNLMSGPSHDHMSGKPRHDRVVYTFTLPCSSGGGW